MQRDVEIEVESADKSGGFIGALFVNKTENAAISLLQEGLATVHPYSADTLSWARQLYDAEVRSRFNSVWENVQNSTEFFRLVLKRRTSMFVFIGLLMNPR
jgi:staphylococcal nuclease domain-containing protein 1